jgi:hypothetical protein
MQIKTEITVRCEECREEIKAKLVQGDQGEWIIEIDPEEMKKHKCD